MKRDAYLLFLERGSGREGESKGKRDGMILLGGPGGGGGPEGEEEVEEAGLSGYRFKLEEDDARGRWRSRRSGNAQHCGGI